MPSNACDMSRDALPTVRSGIRRVQFMVLVPSSSSSQKDVKKSILKFAANSAFLKAGSQLGELSSPICRNSANAIVGLRPISAHLSRVFFKYAHKIVILSGAPH
jgi:hypothetical protein